MKVVAREGSCPPIVDCRRVVMKGVVTRLETYPIRKTLHTAVQGRMVDDRNTGTGLETGAEHPTEETPAPTRRFGGKPTFEI